MLVVFTTQSVLRYARFWSAWWIGALLAAICPIVVNAQGINLLGIPLDTLLKTKAPRVDPAYITTYYGRLHLFVVSDRQDYTLRVLGADHTLRYKPNLAWALGVGVNYKWAGTELTLKVPLLGYNPTQKGNTKPFGVTINYNNRRFWATTQYQFYRGFYLANPNLVEPDWFAHHSTYPSRNDLISQTVIAHAQYLFKPLQVSIPASQLQREGQRKTAGSWLVGSFLTYQLIRADSALVPSSLRIGFPNESNALQFRWVGLGIDAGYIQTFVIRQHYFINLSVRPGLSLLLEEKTGLDQASRTDLRLGWQGLGTLTIGYTSSQYYGGIYGSASLFNRVVMGAFIQTETDYIRLVIGKRLRYRPRGLIKKLPGL